MSFTGDLSQADLAAGSDYNDPGRRAAFYGESNGATSGPQFADAPVKDASDSDNRAGKPFYGQ
jgi:hypothetical protein